MTEEYITPTRRQRFTIVLRALFVLAIYFAVKLSIPRFVSFVSEKTLCEQQLWWRYCLSFLFFIGLVIIYRYIRIGYSNAASVAGMIQDYRFAKVLGEETADLPTSYASSAQFWASAFADGSCFEGLWESGSKIRFLAPSGDGMLSEIAAHRTNEFISIRHFGFIVNGVEDTTSTAIRAWAPAYENYTFLPTPEGTMMVVDQDVATEWEEYITQAWPKALGILKELSESSGAA